MKSARDAEPQNLFH